MPPLANQPPQEVSAKGTKMTDRETEGPIKVSQFTPKSEPLNRQQSDTRRAARQQAKWAQRRVASFKVKVRLKLVSVEQQQQTQENR